MSRHTAELLVEGLGYRSRAIGERIADLQAEVKRRADIRAQRVENARRAREARWGRR